MNDFRRKIFDDKIEMIDIYSCFIIFNDIKFVIIDDEEIAIYQYIISKLDRFKLKISYKLSFHDEYYQYQQFEKSLLFIQILQYSFSISFIIFYQQEFVKHHQLDQIHYIYIIIIQIIHEIVKK